MSDDLLRQARFIVQLFRECSAIQLPHKPTEDVLTGMISRIETLTAERDAAIASLSEAARLRGEAEGKLLAAETPGVLEGWRRRAEAAEAKLAEYKMVASAIDNQWSQEVEAARALTAERDALANLVFASMASVLYPEDRAGYETKEDRHARYAVERGEAIRSYPGAESVDEAVSMALSQALSTIRAAKQRLDSQHAKARAVLTELTGERE